MKAKIGKMRLPKKVMFVLAGVVLLGGASAAFALYASKEMSQAQTEQNASLSGLACTTIQTLKLRRNGQRWIRKYISTENAGGIDRIRTALRVAGVLAKQEKADFYQVVILDHAGPTDRAHMRGAAIGAEVLFAPKPADIPGMTEPFVAKYNDAEANMAGLFHGNEVVMPLDAIKATLTTMTEKSDCADQTVQIGEPGSETEHRTMPGDEEVVAGHEPAGEHGDTAAAAAEGEASATDETGHGEAPVEEAGGEPAAAAETGGGMFSSIKGMIFGANESKGEAPAQGHGAAATPETGGHEPVGMLATVKSMIFGGEAETLRPEREAAVPAGAGDHAGAPADEAIVPEPSHDEAAPEKAEEHAQAKEAAAH